MPGGKGNIKPSDNPKPFKKGENGGGYPKGVPNTRTRLKRLLAMVQENQHPITGEVEDMSLAEQMDAAMVLKALSGDVKAYEQIISRIEGKMKDSIEFKNNTPNKPVDLSGLSEEELRTMQEIQKKIKGD